MYDLTVTYDKGEPEGVTVGQRELAEFELQPFGCNSLEALHSRPVVFLRFVAWAALRRQERLPKKGIPYSAWSELVDSVAFTNRDDDEDSGEAVGPTGLGQSDGA